MKVVKQWPKLPIEVAELPSLDINKKLNGHRPGQPVVVGPLLSSGVGVDGPQRYSSNLFLLLFLCKIALTDFSVLTQLIITVTKNNNNKRATAH